MGGTIDLCHFGIIFGASVLVAHQNRNGRAEGFALKDPGENFTAIALLARGRETTLAGAAAIQFLLNIRF